MNTDTKRSGAMFKAGIAIIFYALAVTTAGTSLYADEGASAKVSIMEEIRSKPLVPRETPAPVCVPEVQCSPLMTVLNEVGLCDPLKKAGINIFGYFQSGYFYDTTAPQEGRGPTFILYNNFKSDLALNRISLNVERTVDATKRGFDIGFRAEGIFGADVPVLHSNGLWDTQTGHNQWDLLQAYVDMTVPQLPMRIRFGKWIELAGFEQVSAGIYGAFGDPMRAFYTYSYQFLYAEPVTQTGTLVTYVLNPQWTIDAGFTFGWNQSLRDANHAIDFLGRVTFAPTDKTTFIFTMTEGPEYPLGFGHNLPEGDSTNYWTALDLVVTHKVDDKLSLGIGIDYVVTPKIPSLESGTKQFGGVAGYASYALNPYLTLNTRAELYSDAANGFSNAAPVEATYYELTGGVAVKPFPKDKILSNLIFRPEIRYDHADRSVFSTGVRDQLTFSIDGLFRF